MLERVAASSGCTALQVIWDDSLTRSDQGQQVVLEPSNLIVVAMVDIVLTSEK